MTVQARNPTASSEDETRMYDVGLEGVVYTLIDVHDGFDEAFERWYESDHFYAGGVLAPYVLSGNRWYASRALRECRYAADDQPFESPTLGTNLATYFLTTAGLRGFYDWINPQLKKLRSTGRMFEERTHVNTDGYRLENVLRFEGAASIRPHIVGNYPFAGLFVAYLDASEGGLPDASVSLPQGTLGLSFRPNAGSLTNESLGLTHAAPGMLVLPVNNTPVRLVLSFLTNEPPADSESTADLTSRIAQLTGSRPLWGGGFLPVVPGKLDHLASLR